MNNDTRHVVMAFLEDTTSAGMDVAAENHAAENVTWWMPGSLRDGPLTRRSEVVHWFKTRAPAPSSISPPRSRSRRSWSRATWLPPTCGLQAPPCREGNTTITTCSS